MEMTLSEAADLIGVPQKRLYRAVKAGKLKAVQRHQGSRWEYMVSREDLEAWDRPTDQPVATDPTTDRPAQQPTARPVDRPSDRPADQHSGPPVEVYAMILDRLQRAERRAVELELAMQQQQRLLCEHAESITEREARARQAEAVAAERHQREQELAEEVARLRDALEATRKPQKRSGLLGWLGFRRAGSSPADASKSA